MEGTHGGEKRPAAGEQRATPPPDLAWVEAPARPHATGRMRALLAVTDPALSFLPTDDLLHALCDRTCSALDADGVAIHLADTSGALRVRATGGRAARWDSVPFGAAVVGRVAAERAVLVIEDLAAHLAHDRATRERVRSVAGVPLLVGERVIGVLAVGTAERRAFDADDVELLRRVADRAASAVARSRAIARAEEARAEADGVAQRLSTMFDAISDGIILYDVHGGVAAMNRGCRDLLALDADPAYSARPARERAALLDVCDADGRAQPDGGSGIERILRGEQVDEDYSMLRLDGRRIVVNVTGTPIYEHGRITGGVAVLHDVTGRRELEGRTHRALAALLDMAGALIGHDETSDPRTTAMQVAAGARAVYGCDVASLVEVLPDSDTILPLATAGRSPDDEAAWYNAVAGRTLEQYVAIEDVDSLHAGEVLPLGANRVRGAWTFDASARLLAPLVTSEGTLAWVMSLAFTGGRTGFTPEELDLARGVARMATLVLQRDRLLRDRENERARLLALEHATKRMDAFLGIAGHELRTPMTSAKANVQFSIRQLRAALEVLGALGAADEDPAVARIERTLGLLRRTEHQFLRQERLVNDLLDVSRIGSGKLALSPSLCDLGAVVRDCVDEQRLGNPERRILLDGPPRPVLIHADADRLAQVVTNYLTNALKYSPAEAAVIVGVSMGARAAVVRVRDQGRGISADQLAHIWDRFYRAEGISHVSGSGVGLGLGLHISRTIVELHGGSVGVASAPGGGSSFLLALPLADP